MGSIFAGFGNIFNEINITTLVHFFFLNWIAITVKTTGVLGTFSPEKAVVNLFMSMYNNVTNANKRVVENQWKAFPKTSILNLKNVLNQYFISLKYTSFQHLNKNHIQAKFNKLAKQREVVICVLLVYLEYFVSFSKLEIFANCV